MKQIKTLLALVTVLTMIVSPLFFAHADDTTQPSADQVSTTPATASSEIAPADATSLDVTASADAGTPQTGSDMTAELALLQAKEQDPNLGFFAKLWISLKIKEIENQINVANAVQ